MAFKSRTQQLNGLPSLSYMGVLPSSPTNFLIKQRAPTPSDYRNTYVGDLWLDNSGMYLSPAVVPTIANLYILMSVSNNIAVWRPFGGGGTVTSVNPGLNIQITGTAVAPVVNVTGTVDHSVLLGNATGSINSLVNGTTGQYLIAQTLADPVWATINNVTGLLAQNGTTVLPTLGVIPVSGAGTVSTSGAITPGTLTISVSGSDTVSFGSYLIADLLNQTGTGTNVNVVFDTVTYDTGNNYNTATGTFTAPSGGLYQFNSTVSVTNLSAAMTAGLWSFTIGGTGPDVGTWGVTRNNAFGTRDLTNNIWRSNGALSVRLDANDTVNVVLQIAGGAGNTATILSGGNSGSTWFTGYKVA